MSTPYGPDQSPQPSGPPAQPGSYGPTGPLPPPVDPFAPEAEPGTPPGPYGSPPQSTPYGPPPPGPYGPPTQGTPSGPYGPLPQSTPYGQAPHSAPPGPYGPPPHSAPPGPYGPSTPYSAPPGWPGGPPAQPPAPSRTGRTLAVVLGVTLPVIVIILAVVGLLVVPRVLNNLQADANSSITPSSTADPLAVPTVGSCYDHVLESSPFSSDAEEAELVPCNEEHTVETVAVGELADVARPPDMFSDRARELYRACEQGAQEYLGVAWRSTYTWLVLSVPSSAAWAEGARWYRCDLTVNGGFYQQRPERTTGSLRDGVEPITCLTWFATDNGLSRIEPSDCTDEHQGELAGVFPVPEDADYGDIDALVDQFDELCVPVVLDYLQADRIPDELSYWFAWPNETDFDQWVLCLVSAEEDNRSFVGSVRGLGSGPIPFA